MGKEKLMPEKDPIKEAIAELQEKEKKRDTKWVPKKDFTHSKDKSS